MPYMVINRALQKAYNYFVYKCSYVLFYCVFIFNKDIDNHWIAAFVVQRI